VKAGWDAAELVKVAKVFTDGNWIETKDQATEGIRLVQTGNVGEGLFKDRRDKARFIDHATFKRLNCFEVLPGDCLISRLPDPVGRACIVPDTGDMMITAVDCSIVRVDEARVDRNFLVYFTLTDDYLRAVEALCSGTTRNRISRYNLGKVTIPLPPLEEQQRIVAVLDEAFEGLTRARAHAEANLQNARELFANFLGAVFSKAKKGWRTAKLDQLVEDDCTLSYGIVQPGDEILDGLPIVRPTDLGKRTITLEGLKTIDPENARGYARTVLKGSEILLCVRGSTGVVSMASEELAGANVTRGIVPVRFDATHVNQQLGYYQFLSKPIQEQIKAGTYGAALMQINIRDLRLINFVVPPIDQQAAIVGKLDSVANDFDQLVASYEHKVSEIDTLRQSILQKAFNGELSGDRDV
jgi:type I restriction enzyme, S subunit